MSPNRLTAHFTQASREGRKSLVLFLTAGFPDLETTERLIETIAEAGADVLELGVPFSDPIADGPTIQAASQVALKGGTTLEKILALVERVRRSTQIPIVLFGAYNPFLYYGLDRLARRAIEVGVDGFLVPDLPMEESDEFDAICRDAGLCLVYLVAPTTPPERMREIARRSTGFLYFISLKGVTGTSITVSDALREKVRQLREVAGSLDNTRARSGAAGTTREGGPLPVAVGFGIQTPEQAAEVAKICDAVVVGSELIRVVDRCKSTPDLLPQVAAYTRSLKESLR
jgi:tryptophan synthase alpha chain